MSLRSCAHSGTICSSHFKASNTYYTYTDPDVAVFNFYDCQTNLVAPNGIQLLRIGEKFSYTWEINNIRCNTEIEYRYSLDNWNTGDSFDDKDFATVVTLTEDTSSSIEFKVKYTIDLTISDEDHAGAYEIKVVPLAYDCG